jgi:hypothetical protein
LLLRWLAACSLALIGYPAVAQTARTPYPPSVTVAMYANCGHSRSEAERVAYCDCLVSRIQETVPLQAYASMRGAAAKTPLKFDAAQQATSMKIFEASFYCEPNTTKGRQ